MDKTGTLTTGKLSVVESHFEGEAADTAGVILGLVSSSHHPVAQAVAVYLSSTYPLVSEVQLDGVKEVPGRGIEAHYRSARIRGGNAAWLDVGSEHVTFKEELSLFIVKSGPQIIASFGLSDTIRPSALSAVQYLKNRGMDVYIVSGDGQGVVDAVATRLSIPLDHAFGECLPQAKLDHVRELQKLGTKNHGNNNTTAVFIGDGTNDSLALAQAEIGVSLSSGTDIALSAADIVILDPESGTANLEHSLRVIFDVSRGAVHRIMVNFLWAFVYNFVAVLFAAGVFVKVVIAPEYAGLGEMVSIVPVVIVAWSMWLLKR